MAGIDSYTKLMLHCDGDDSASNHNMTFHGDPILSTSQKKFGSSSLLLDGTDDYLSASDHADFDFGANDFTVETWARWGTTPSGNQLIAAHYDYGSSDGSWYFRATATGFRAGFSDDRTADDGHYVALDWTYSIVADTWYHLALVRSGNNVILFINGVLQSSQAMSLTLFNSTAELTIGCFLNSGTPASLLDARIDEIKMSTAAQWTANFTPETSAYSVATPPHLKSRYIYPVDKIPPAIGLVKKE